MPHRAPSSSMALTAMPRDVQWSSIAGPRPPSRARPSLLAPAVAMLAIVAHVGCGPQACPVPVRDPSQVQGPLLWRVTAADGTGPVLWLFGTIHDAGAEDVAPAAWAALAASPRFVSELGDQELDHDKFRDQVKLPRGKGLDQQLAMDDWFDLRDTLRGTIHEEDLARVRPWYALTLLTRVVTDKAFPGMDVLLADRARALHLPVDHLETWEEQLPLLANAIDIDDLARAIHERRAMRCQLVNTRAAYVAGDLAMMEQVFDHDPTGTMLAPRNRRWLPLVEDYLSSGGAFVAVGIGHLVGPDGLPTLLTAAGYRVARSPRQP